MKNKWFKYIIFWLCFFLISYITTGIIMNKSRMNYFENGEVYCWEEKSNPFLTDEERFHHIYILDVKDGYVKYIYIDYPEDLDSVEQIAEKYSCSGEINRLYPYFKKINN